jgi:hypothetical protein
MLLQEPNEQAPSAFVVLDHEERAHEPESYHDARFMRVLRSFDIDY